MSRVLEGGSAGYFLRGRALSVVVAILAAGESRRMGAPKLCLPWVGGKSILQHEVESWRAAGVAQVLVIRPREADSPVARELRAMAGLDQLASVPTSAPEGGMMGSVVTSARWAADVSGNALGHSTPSPSGISHLIFSLGDQPQLLPSTLHQVVAACGEHAGRIVRPRYEGRGGHPVAIPQDLLPALADADAALTLRSFLHLHADRLLDLPCPDAGLLLDLDTPEEYRHALRAAEGA